MEEQGLVLVKSNFLTKIKQTIKRFFSKRKIKDLLDEKQKKKVQFFEFENDELVQDEILNARRAFRKYVINNTRDISEDVLSFIAEKFDDNKEKISKIIEINKDDITYQEIIEMVIAEKQSIINFKQKDGKTGRYSVPIGVIGIECEGVKDSLSSFLKAISTRNAILVLQQNYNKYSTEELLLLIIKECLKNYYIDDDLIQMLDINEIDISKLDKLIKEDGETIQKDLLKAIYIYQEDESFNEKVENELERLENCDLFKSYEIKPIKGNFGDIVNYLGNNEVSAVCMYTNNAQKAYKFINWINSPNVFVNTGIKECNTFEQNNSEYFNYKYILHEDVF